MHDIPVRSADVLLEVEAAPRSNGLWDTHKPACDALSGTTPFCLDTLSVEQWLLQWVFLPRMKYPLENTRPLPERSGIFVYASEYHPKNDPATHSFLKLIKQFDDLISMQSGASRH